jgi:hypothetical protein
MVEGQRQGGYTDLYEIICCDCGDNPYLDYREVSPKPQRIRGPHPIAVGVTAYKEHVQQHPGEQAIPPAMRSNADNRPLPVRGYKPAAIDTRGPAGSRGAASDALPSPANRIREDRR